MSLITGIFGKMGSGKTMLLTRFGLNDFAHGKEIYSNYHLKNIKYTPIATLNDLDKIRDGTLLLDEMQLWVHARSSMAKLNQEILKIIMMSRKRALDIYYTSQLTRTIDVLLREVTDYYVYPMIKPFKINNNDEFRLTYTAFDIYGFKLGSLILKKPLSYYGGFFDTKQEVKFLSKDENTPLCKGIKLEEIFVKALKKLNVFNHIELLPNSGKDSTWNYDIIAYSNGKTYCFDVKGSNYQRINLETYGNALKNKITNAYQHNSTPYLAFPKSGNKLNASLKRWYVYPLTYNSYLVTLSSKPFYKKIVQESILLEDFLCTNAHNPTLRVSPLKSVLS